MSFKEAFIIIFSLFSIGYMFFRLIGGIMGLILGIWLYNKKKQWDVNG